MSESKLIEKENGIYYISICRGCKTYEDEINNLTDAEKKGICNVSYPFIDDTVCPCSECIVKMVCEHTCKKLNSYIFSNNKKRNEGII